MHSISKYFYICLPFKGPNIYCSAFSLAFFFSLRPYKRTQVFLKQLADINYPLKAIIQNELQETPVVGQRLKLIVLQGTSGLE